MVKHRMGGGISSSSDWSYTVFNLELKNIDLIERVLWGQVALPSLPSHSKRQ